MSSPPRVHRQREGVTLRIVRPAGSGSGGGARPPLVPHIAVPPVPLAAADLASVPAARSSPEGHGRRPVGRHPAGGLLSPGSPPPPTFTGVLRRRQTGAKPEGEDRREPPFSTNELGKLIPSRRTITEDVRSHEVSRSPKAEERPLRARSRDVRLVSLRALRWLAGAFVLRAE